jgi:hypothetical protein
MTAMRAGCTQIRSPCFLSPSLVMIVIAAIWTLNFSGARIEPSLRRHACQRGGTKLAIKKIACSNCNTRSNTSDNLACRAVVAAMRTNSCSHSLLLINLSSLQCRIFDATRKFSRNCTIDQFGMRLRFLQGVIKMRKMDKPLCCYRRWPNPVRNSGGQHDRRSAVISRVRVAASINAGVFDILKIFGCQ